MLRDLAVGLLAALTISAAWWMPGSIPCALLGWITAGLLVWIAWRARYAYSASFLSGFMIHPLAFYWLYGAIRSFGGFPPLGAAAVFGLFAAVSGLQYPIFIFIFRALPKYFDGIACRTAIAWTVSEFTSLRLFPWCLGHTQLAVTPFAQAASLGGSYFLTFLMMWLAESVLRVRWKTLSLRIASIPATVIAALTIYGAVLVHQFKAEPPATNSVALIQANVSIDEKHDISLLTIDRDRYVQLSLQALKPGMLIVWPESVIEDFIPDSVGSAINEPLLPYWQGSYTSFLVGALTYRSEQEMYNSAVAVYRDGTVPPPYHKRILMPFGEYTPFGETFPWLKELDGLLGAFTPGTKPVVFAYPMNPKSDEHLNVSPLICYEDVVPRLSREAVAEGAEVLANLTNDAWFGNTVAPYQHHLIATFRAIENHRYLIRSTNTGFTAIVNPLGATTVKLPPYTEGIAYGAVAPYSDRTVYSVIGDLPWWALSALTALLIVLRWFVKRYVIERVMKWYQHSKPQT